MITDVTLTRTANGRYHKIIKRGKDGLPIYTPLFEVGDGDRDPGRDEAIAWANRHGYTVR